MNEDIKLIRGAIDRLRGTKFPFIFSFLEEVDDSHVAVDSVFGGTYDQGILMMVTLMTHLHQTTGASFFEIFFDLGSQLASSEIKRDPNRKENREATEQEVKDKVISFLKAKNKNGKKPD